MKKIIFFILICQNCLSQVAVPYEQKIYESVDFFVANPTLQNVTHLSQTEKDFYQSNQPKTKSDFLALVILKCNKAYYLNRFGKTNWAIKTYEQAWTIYKKQKLSNYDIIEYCLKPLGNLYTIIGDYQNAENTIKEYYFLSNQATNLPENKIHKISAILNLSAVYQSEGKHLEAIALIENALQFEKLSWQQKGKLYNNLGTNYLLLDNTLKAEDNFKKSLHLLKNKSEAFLEIANAYKNLSQVYQKQNKIDLALTTYEQAILNTNKISDTNPREIAKLYYGKALLLFYNKDSKSASQFLAHVFNTLLPNFKKNGSRLPKKEQLYPDTLLMDALDLTGKLYLLENDSKKALESYRLSFYVEELMQDHLLYEDSKIIFQLKSRNRTEECVSILYNLYRLEKKQKYAEEAFLLADASKAAVLNSFIDKNENASRKEKQLIAKIQELNSEIIKEQLKQERANVSKINDAIRQQNETMLALKQLKKVPAVPNRQMGISNLIQKTKEDNATIISYFFGNKSIYVFTLAKDQTLFYRLPEYEKTKNTTRDLIAFFSESDKISNNPNAFCETSNALFKLLHLDKIKTQKNTIIIPDGLLNFIPFESLVIQKTTTTNYSKIPFMLYQTQISYNNSATSYLNSKSSEAESTNVLGVFPIFKNTSFSLPYSEKEYDYISKNFNGKYFKNKEATYANFKNNSNNFNILHLSTHATSGDIYEPAQIKFADRDVLFNELYTVKTKANLIVLSACETGLGKMYQGEGFMSVSRGFQMAGAQNLVFSLWKVNDFTTYKIIENLYTHIKEGSSYAEANRKAKMDYLQDENIPNAKKSPYYWSPMVYYGAINHQQNNKNLTILLVISIAIVLTALFYGLRKNNFFG